jgi:hypothetical protein
MNQQNKQPGEAQQRPQKSQDDRKFAEKQQAVLEQESPAAAKQPKPGKDTKVQNLNRRPDHLPV